MEDRAQPSSNNCKNTGTCDRLKNLTREEEETIREGRGIDMEIQEGRVTRSSTAGHAST